jgi:hypothetical protein
MNPRELESLEQKLQTAGTDLRYPPTPPIASSVMERLKRPRRPLAAKRWSWAVLAVVVLLSALMLVPPARAAILEVIQIGVVRIFRGPSMPPAAVPTSTQGAPIMQVPLTATPITHTPPTVTSIPTILDIAGETTLSEAQASVKFRIMLPTIPADLGKPDHVYLQNPGDAMLILVWLQPLHHDQMRMSLQEIAPGSWAIGKFNPPTIQDTSVNGKPAVWTGGPYMLESRNHNYVNRRLIAGHVLIWEQNKITYRLETDLPLEEAIKVAESLKPAQ